MYRDLKAYPKRRRESEDKLKTDESSEASRTQVSFLGVASDSPDSVSLGSSSVITTAETDSAVSEYYQQSTDEFKKDLAGPKACDSFVDSSATLVDTFQQEDIPIEMDKPMSRQSSAGKPVACGPSGPTVDEKLVGRSWLENYKGSITNPEVLTHLRKEGEKGSEGFS